MTRRHMRHPLPGAPFSLTLPNRLRILGMCVPSANKILDLRQTSISYQNEIMQAWIRNTFQPDGSTIYRIFTLPKVCDTESWPSRVGAMKIANKLTEMWNEESESRKHEWEDFQDRFYHRGMEAIQEYFSGELEELPPGISWQENYGAAPAPWMGFGNQEMQQKQVPPAFMMIGGIKGTQKTQARPALTTAEDTKEKQQTGTQPALMETGGNKKTQQNKARPAVTTRTEGLGRMGTQQRVARPVLSAIGATHEMPIVVEDDEEASSPEPRRPEGTSKEDAILLE